MLTRRQIVYLILRNNKKRRANGASPQDTPPAKDMTKE